MGKGFELEFAFVEKWGRLADAEYLRIYIYALSNYKKSGKILSIETISKKLHISPETVEDAIDFWITAEVLLADGNGYAFEYIEKPEGETKTPSAITRILLFLVKLSNVASQLRLRLSKCTFRTKDISNFT